MNIHKNARLTPKGREILISRVNRRPNLTPYRRAILTP